MNKLDTVDAEMLEKANDCKVAGNQFFNANNYKNAVKKYLQGLEYNYNSPDLHSNISAAYFCLESYHEAEEHGLFAAFLKPKWYKSYSRVARALQAQGRAGDAVKCLEEGLDFVDDIEGRKELTKLIEEYKHDPSYVPVSSDRISRKSKVDSHTTMDSDSDIDMDMSVFSDITNGLINNKKTLARYSSLQDSGMKESEKGKDLNVNTDSNTELNSNISSVTVNKELTNVGLVAGSSGLQGNYMTENNINEEVDLEPFREGNAIDDKIKSDENIIDEFLKEQMKKKNVPSTQLDYLACLPSLDRPGVPKDLRALITSGFQSAIKGNIHKAVESYRAALDFAQANQNDVPTFETHIINYALNVVIIDLGTYDDLVLALNNFTEMQNLYQCCNLGACFNCAKIYFKLNRFKEALERLESYLETIDTHPFMKHLWPGSTEGHYFEETTRKGLKEATEMLQQLCKTPPQVAAICRYSNCLSLSTHIVPSTHIYLGDPDFIGYITVSCQEKCKIDFHNNCWKSLRDDKVSKVSKICDKDMLGQPCITEGCITGNGERSVITYISIIGQDGQVKTTLTFKCNDHILLSKKSKKNKSKSNEEKPASTKASKSKVVSKKKELPVANVRSKPKSGVKKKESLKKQISILETLRETNFGILPDHYYNPQLVCYGNREEQSLNDFLDPTVKVEQSDISEAKDFLFSYFQSVLLENGLQKIDAMEEQWGIMDIFHDFKAVLPETTRITDVLTESTRFCIVDDYICLSEQLPDVYNKIQTELSENVGLMLMEYSDKKPKTLDSKDKLEAYIEEKTHLPSAWQHADPELPPADTLEGKFFKSGQQELLQALYFSDDPDEFEGEITESSSDTEYYRFDGELDNKLQEVDSISLEEEIYKKIGEELDVYPDFNLETFKKIQAAQKCNVLDLIQNTTIDNNNKIKELADGVNSYLDFLKPKREINHMECQTEYSDINENFELKNKVENLYLEINELKNSLSSKNAEIKKMEVAHTKQIQKLEDEKIKILEKQEKNLKRLKAESNKHEETLKKIHDDLLIKNEVLSSEVSKKSAIIKQAETTQQILQNAVGDNMVKKHRAVLADLNSRKCFCEYQIKVIKRRCLEKISEYKSLLSLCSEESEDLHCWDRFKQSIKLWEDYALKVNNVEASFQEIYNKLNDKLARGEDVEDMNVLKLNSLPEEPQLLQVDELISSILKRYEVRIHHLKLLIANAPVSVNQRNSYYAHNPLLGQPIYIPPPIVPPALTTPPPPRPPSPTVLPFTYRFPPAAQWMTPNVFLNRNKILAGPSCFDIQHSNLNQGIPVGDNPLNDLNKPTVLSNNIDTSKPPPQNLTSSSAASTFTPITASNSLSSLILEDTLPRPLSKMNSHSNSSLGVEENQTLGKALPTASVSYSNLEVSELNAENDINILKKSSKKTDTQQKSVTTSNAENTVKTKTTKPELVVEKEPLPQTSKNKKKNKSKKQPIVDKRPCMSISPCSSTTEGMDLVGAVCSSTKDEDIDPEYWQPVGRKKKIALLNELPKPLISNNKLKLMETLRNKFPRIPAKELDELVMMVRQLNGNSLSGLPVTEIESRVEQQIKRKSLKKSSEMGLEKFNDGAWGEVVEEDFDWSHIAPDECTICLEPIKNALTTLECNHIFHTTCIRKWLQEKSVCPLCNKFSTIPDDFPDLP